jgi:hypothetical protein
MQSGRRQIRRAFSARLAVILLTLLAFTSQSIVTQSHIHNGALSGHAFTVAQKSAHQPLPAKAPAGDDQANCPICQGLLHAGSYLAPSAAAVMLSTIATLVSVVVVQTVAIAPTHSHAWKSRAPPSD